MTNIPNSPFTPGATPAIPAPVVAYATPAAYHTTAHPGTLWREGKTLIALKNATLPPTCVKCGGAATEKPLRKTFYWHQPWLYILILFPGLLIYAIVALVIREKGTISFGLCKEHRNRRTFGIMLGWMLIPGFLVLIIAAAANESGWMVGAAFLSLIGGIIGVIMAQSLRPTKIDPNFLWLKGVSPLLLDTLPAVAPSAGYIRQ